MNSIDEVEDKLIQLKRIFDKEGAILQQLEKTRLEKEKLIKNQIEEREQHELKKVLIVEAAKEAREQARDVLKDMGTNALRFIIGEEMSLEIELKEQSKQWIANFITTTNIDNKHTVETDPAEEDGGGVADVVAIATQTAMLQLTGDKNVAPWFLDEPSKYVSKGNSEQVAKFFLEISKTFNRQIHMVTHDEYLANIGDTAYHFTLVDDTSKVRKIS